MSKDSSKFWKEWLKDFNPDISPKGDYIVWVEPNNDGTVDVFSTNSPFWRDFFS